MTVRGCGELGAKFTVMMNEQEKIIELIQLKMQRDNLDPELI
jgi:hypothetical protein